ncbi:MAG: efflux RND transporter periplasmic adaptor subunit [Planctomycetota bacterium]
MSRSGNSASFITGAVLVCAGILIGYFLRPIVDPVVEEDPSVTAAQDQNAGHTGHGSDVIGISETTITNMELETGRFEVRDYPLTLQIPGEVVEKFSEAHLEIVAPVGGRVSRVFVTSGQAVEPGDALFELSVTDEALTSAQVDLLSVVAESRTVQQRLERIEPLVSTGAVASRQVQDVRLELQKLDARRIALIEELKLHGLTLEAVNDLLDGSSLQTSITVTAPENGTAASAAANTSPIVYTVESVDGVQGKTIMHGGRLCELTNHGHLLIKGMAFESDVAIITDANAEARAMTAEFGEEPDVVRVENLNLLSVENRVDEESQTYPVYVEIENEVSGESTDSLGRRYLQWKYKPGQRCHLEVPSRVWEDVVVVPAGALVREGPETFVFKKLDHTHAAPGGEPMAEFQKIPVKVLHTDRRFAVLEQQVSLDLYENYVLDQAYLINLALKQAENQGVVDHGHEH